MTPDEARFQRRLRLFDQHKLALAGAAVLMAIGSFTPPWGFALWVGGGCLAVLAGWRAREGGESAITGIGVAIGDNEVAEKSWTTREIENMSPAERANHADETGGFLIIGGIVVIVLGVVAAAIYIGR